MRRRRAAPLTRTSFQMWPLSEVGGSQSTRPTVGEHVARSETSGRLSFLLNHHDSVTRCDPNALGRGEGSAFPGLGTSAGQTSNKGQYRIFAPEPRSLAKALPQGVPVKRQPQTATLSRPWTPPLALDKTESVIAIHFTLFNSGRMQESPGASSYWHPLCFVSMPKTEEFRFRVSMYTLLGGTPPLQKPAKRH